MSVPQIGVQFGEIHNNNTGGGNDNGNSENWAPYSNGSSSSLPGSGYPLVFCSFYKF